MALEMRGIVKKFPGLLALNNVDFSVKKGEVHALLGVNGAGKSTLIKILSGVYSMDSGEIVLDGKAVDMVSPAAAKEFGVATVYQHPQMIPSFTGFENIYLGSENPAGWLFPRIKRAQLRRRAQELLKRFPFDIDLDRPVLNIPAVEREVITILRALSQNDISVLILDEPTSILTRKESKILFSLIRMLKNEGISIIYITHRLDEVFEIADSFTVFRNGENVGTHRTVKSDDAYAEVVEMMLGDKIGSLYPERNSTPGEVILEVDDLKRGKDFDNVTFKAKRGEVLGIFGLVGSGIDQLAKVIAGVNVATGGKMALNGRRYRPRAGAVALARGVFIVPGDRGREGSFDSANVAFNTTISNLGKITTAFFLSRKRELRDAMAKIDEYDIRPRDATAIMGQLSGGNQQKTLMARAGYSGADLYIFCEPTVGVDVGAKAGIYKRVRSVADSGKGVIVISSDCEEVFGVADRVVVMYQGRVVINRPVGDVSLDEVLLTALTGSTNPTSTRTLF
jgi:ABC-type sugar transport system ATPase subunit